MDSETGISDQPISPHQPMKVEGQAIITTPRKTTFDGRALATELNMTGKDILAAPVRLTAAVDGKPLAFAADAAPPFGKVSAIEVDLTGALNSGPLNVNIADHMEYDGAQWITLDLSPTAKDLALDCLRLEIPVKPERGQFLYTIAMADRESWQAADLTQGKGKV